MIKTNHLSARSALAAGMVAVRYDFMSDILNKPIGLVLNRDWQAINIRAPPDAFCQMRPASNCSATRARQGNCG